MKKFRFKLETVERVRKIKEDEALKNYSLAQRKFREEMSRKQALLDGLASALERREKLAAEGITAGFLQIEDAFVTGNKQRIQGQDQVIFRARKKLEKSLAGFKKARQASKTMERLREHAMEDYKEYLKKIEIRELDDLTVMRARLEKEGEE